MSEPVLLESRPLHAFQLLLQGRVQGVGVRPAIARLAKCHGVTGFVKNITAGVVVHAESNSLAILQQFHTQLQEAIPGQAGLNISDCTATTPLGMSEFSIRTGDSTGPLQVLVPPDLSTCHSCQCEVNDHNDRRHYYPFTSCTACGPRYSIIQSMPYERDSTSMQAFTLCDNCQAEYTDNNDRRFHAQTNACPVCGPRLQGDENATPTSVSGDQVAAALSQAAAIICNGGIVALKGLGGYQLICDATNTGGVERLRTLKRRPTKPLAVMVEWNLTLAANISKESKKILRSQQNPIVLCRNPSIPSLSPSVNPGMSTTGIFLPTTPLHDRLLQRVRRPLVVTSGNIDNEPLAFETEEADNSFGEIADLIVHHNRRILRPVDDSVVRIIANRAVTIRCGRGIAPLPIPVKTTSAILAVGGDQKVAPALSNGVQSVLGPHIGNMSTIAGRERFVREVNSLQSLYRTSAEVIAHDLHPDFFTTQWARQQNKPAIAVQHHHAHVAAGMLEHGLIDSTALGVAFDGTGYGTDGTIWGGEFLRTTATAFERVARLRPLALPGGEIAIRQPWRAAISLLTACNIAIGPTILNRLSLTSDNKAAAVRAIQHIINSPQAVVTSSMGRPFDGVAALVLGQAEATFEGELAMRLEDLCDESCSGQYTLPVVRENDLPQLCWKGLLHTIVRDLTDGVASSTVAMRFHRGIAMAVADVVRQFPLFPVVLAGGCFQNKILTELVYELLADHPSGVYLPGSIPPNDGGLAAGQLLVAAARLEQSRHQTEELTCA